MLNRLTIAITATLVAALVAAHVTAFAAVVVPAAKAGRGDVIVYTVDGTFAEVVQDTADAIIGRGLKIDHRSYIGDMLARTAADVGSAKKIFIGAEAFQFCSAVYSRRTMEADPGNIAYCPYVIFVYERADKPGVVHVGFRRLDDEVGSAASRTAVGAVNGLLDAIVREAAGMF
jgi:hypothetical protein